MVLNCSLPVMSGIEDVLETNGLSFPLPEERWGYSYNCWGFVAYSLGWEDDPQWLRDLVMEGHLSVNTTPISKDEAMAGDIVVFRYEGGSLAHTALLTHELDIICHKPGASDLCVDSMERAISMYGNNVSYVRPKLKMSLTTDNLNLNV
jgi:hypothetical protein